MAKSTKPKNTSEKKDAPVKKAAPEKKAAPVKKAATKSVVVREKREMTPEEERLMHHNNQVEYFKEHGLHGFSK